jgi:hypothetical protein
MALSVQEAKTSSAKYSVQRLEENQRQAKNLEVDIDAHLATRFIDGNMDYYVPERYSIDVVRLAIASYTVPKKGWKVEISNHGGSKCLTFTAA